MATVASTGTGTQLLRQHITGCPSCGQAAAVHVSLELGDPILVRIVCVSGCPETDQNRVAVVDMLYGSNVA